MIKALFKPLRYLSIKANDNGGKLKVDFIIPFTASAVLSSIFLYLKIAHQIHLFNTDNSLIQNVSGMAQTLPGFYIAALAAISTFPSASMNNPMPEPTPYLKSSDNSEKDRLTRRRFLCYMFAYLAYISIVTLFLTSTIVFTYRNSLFEAPAFFEHIAYFFSCLFVYFLLIQIVLLTFVGLWYLGERIHLNDPEDIIHEEKNEEMSN